jgi:prolyl oligopeptidase
VSAHARPASLLAGLAALTTVLASLAQGSPDEVDRLRWLEPPKNERAVAWGHETTAASTAALTGRASYQQTLRELRQALAAAPAVSDIALLGPYAVRFHRDVQHPKGMLQRADRSSGAAPGPWRTMLDVGQLSRSEGVDYDLQWSSDRCLPPAFDRCLLSLGVAGGDKAVMREFDLAAARFVEGGFSLPASQHVAAWLDRDAIVVGHDLTSAPTTAARWPAQAHLWRRGTALQTSRKIFTAAPTDALFQLYPLGEGRTLLVQTVDFSTYVLHIVDAAGATTRLTLPQKLKPFGFQGATAHHLFVQVAEDATWNGLRIPAESIVSYDFASGTQPGHLAIVYTPARGEVTSSLGFAATRTRVVFPVRASMRTRLLGARYDGKQWRIAPVGRAEAGVDVRVTGADPMGEELTLLKEGFLTPPSIELVREDGSATVVERASPAFDASKHAVEVRQARAPDGESLDYFLIAPKQRRGPVPTLMTGYGAFGVSLSPAYPTTAAGQFYGGSTLQLWFQHGGALVVPAIRGGGERGDAWHRAAMGDNRRRSYDDFIAVAGDLLRLGITDRTHLGVFGTSNGGLLAAVVGVQRPDLFSAVVADAPLTDMLRFTEMGAGAAWTAEYGDPKDSRAAAALARYSPLHNVRTGVDYPAFFISVAATDNVVGPGHARKLAKRLADADAKVFFLEAEAGGHDVSDLLLRPEMMAMRATFLFDQLVQSKADTAFVNWAKSRAVPLKDFTASETGMQAVRDLVGSARVVALGEPAHGAHEPLAFRNRLFAHLVEEFGFTAIALESGLSESRRVNDFVLGGRGDPRAIARDNLTWGFGGYAENVELLRWIRQYNAAAPARKVRFYGIDVSGASDGNFTTARIALDDALRYLETFAANVPRRVRAELAPFLQRFTRQDYLNLSPVEKRQLRNAVASLGAILQQHQSQLLAASSPDEFAWAQRSAAVAGQVEELFRLWPADMPADGISAGFQQAAAARDAAMADNVRWALRLEGAAGRMLVYAHNAHVMNAKLRGGIWSVYRQPPQAMGQHLRAALRRDLVIVGTASATNGPGLPQESANGNSLEDALSPVGAAPFLLDLRSAADAAQLAPWLREMQSMRANFTTRMLVTPQEAFDALVFLEPLTAAGD